HVRRFAVIGLGRFGTTLARELSRLGAEVLAVDRTPEHVAGVADDVALALVGDATQEKFLRECGVGSVDVAIVSMGKSFEATQLATVLLKRLGVPRVLTKSSVPVRIKILTRIGADEVVSPEKEGAERLAQKLLSPNLVEYLDLAGDRALVQVIAPAAMVGKTIGEIDVRRRYNVNIVAIRKRVGAEGETLNDLPRPDDVIEDGDVLVV
ncbi:MAG: TrkA family potassium uptake protein, partial [Phycisphaeraceae bacterium]|nr:TrkA family potassium uptake protein [Phycisphaeraceae bacterium]